MHKRKVLLLSLALFLFLSSLASAVRVDSVKLNEISIQEGLEYGPGSKAPLFSPIETEYAWVSNVEPQTVTWTIYNPYVQEITKIKHTPSIKKQQTDGSWIFGDRTAFTIPAFASKGNWLASCEFEFVDGTTFQGLSADNPNVYYLAIPVTREDWIASIFTAPWYFLGFSLPAYFWFPGFIIWVPILYIIICAMLSRSIGGFVDVTRSAVSAARKARGKKKRRIKK